MKKMLFAGLAAVALVSGAQAVAQPMEPPHAYGPDRPDRPGGWDLNRRMDWLQQRIDRGQADGSLDRREAGRVRQELGRIRGDEDRMRGMHDGRLSDRDRMMLQERLDRLSNQIRWLRHNDERRPW